MKSVRVRDGTRGLHAQSDRPRLNYPGRVRPSANSGPAILHASTAANPVRSTQAIRCDVPRELAQPSKPEAVGGKSSERDCSRTQAVTKPPTSHARTNSNAGLEPHVPRHLLVAVAVAQRFRHVSCAQDSRLPATAMCP
jgi:hypothetical protein